MCPFRLAAVGGRERARADLSSRNLVVDVGGLGAAVLPCSRGAGVVVSGPVCVSPVEQPTSGRLACLCQLIRLCYLCTVS